MKTSKSAVDNFINQKTFAVVGASRDKRKFGNAIYGELKKKKYKVYPVNSGAIEIDGDKCFANIKDLPEKPDAIILCVKPEKTETIIKEAVEIGIKNIWMQQGSESDEAINLCKANNINLIHNECVLMFMEPVGSVHKFHKFLWRIFGKLPE
jgi:predicted CoA-binding protein